MRLPISYLSLGILLSFFAICPAAAADVEAGKADFKKCALCHTAEAGQNKIGPSLFGLVGRKTRSVGNFTYPEIMKQIHHPLISEILDTRLSETLATRPV